MKAVKLKDGREVLIGRFRQEDKEQLIQMYRSLSREALRWAMPPYTREVLERGWLSNLQNLLPIAAFHKDRMVGHAQVYKFPHCRRKGTGA